MSEPAPLYLTSSPTAFLETLFARRKRVNPRYSLRAFASSLEVSPSVLCEVFAGRKRFSTARLRALPSLLRVEALERRHFRLLVDLENAVDPRRRKLLRNRIANNAQRARAVVLRNDQTAKVVYWDSFLVAESFAKDPGWQDAQTVARSTGIDPDRAKSILDALADEGLLERDRREKRAVFRRSLGQVIASAAQDNAVFKALHHEGLSRARAAVDSVPIDRRYSATEMLTFGPELLPAIRRTLEDSLDQIQRLSSRKRREDAAVSRETFAVSLHLFPAKGSS